MTSQKTYEKNDQIVYVNDKFIYCSSVYLIWKWGASLLEEKYYSSKKPITLKKQIVKKKNYIIQRFFDLQFAPEVWLQENGYTLLTNII